MPINDSLAEVQVRLEDLTKEDAQRIWREADAVCFDVDSTVITEEGIDELAKFCGVGQQVKQMTVRAMGGGMTFQDALRTRLEIINPTSAKLEEFRRLQSNRLDVLLTPGVRCLVSLLRSRGTAIYLVSGGFQQLIKPVAQEIGISMENVYANRLLFDKEGKYAGFDKTSLTCCSGGKARAVGQVKSRHCRVVMIGDGATDMEACPPADAFIGFGGNSIREAVRKSAPWYVYSMQELIDVLQERKSDKLRSLEFNTMVPHITPPLKSCHNISSEQ